MPRSFVPSRHYYVYCTDSTHESIGSDLGTISVKFWTAVIYGAVHLSSVVNSCLQIESDD